MAEITGQRSVVLQIDSRPDNTVLISAAVRGICELTGMTGEEVNHTELCVAEAVNNAIEHAYENHTGCTVEVRAMLAGNHKLMLEVRDTGKSMPDEVRALLSGPSSPDQDLARSAGAAQVSGRGIAIMRRYMHNLSYRTGENGINCLSMEYNTA